MDARFSCSTADILGTSPCATILTSFLCTVLLNFFPFFLVFSNTLSTHKHCFLHAQQDPSSPIQYSTITQISMVNEFPVNTPPTFTPNNRSTQHTSLIGGWVAYLVNKTFVEAQLARPVEYETAVLTSCFFKKSFAARWSEEKRECQEQEGKIVKVRWSSVKACFSSEWPLFVSNM